MIGTLLSLGSSLLGGLFGKKKDASTTKTTSNSSSTTDQTSESLLEQLTNQLSSKEGSTTAEGSNTYDLDPATQELINKLTGRYTDTVGPVDLGAYKEQGIDTINENARATQEALKHNFAIRGISGSPAEAASMSGLDVARFGDINKLEASIPMLIQQLTQDNLSRATSFLSTTPKNTKSTNETAYADLLSSILNSTQQGNNTSQSKVESKTVQDSNTTGSSGTGGVSGAIGGLASAVPLVDWDSIFKKSSVVGQK